MFEKKKLKKSEHRLTEVTSFALSVGVCVRVKSLKRILADFL